VRVVTVAAADQPEHPNTRFAVSDGIDPRHRATVYDIGRTVP
jgi:hypothetical protein